MPEPPAQAKKVIIVDDDDSLREVLGHVLEREGFQVLAAGDGETARSKILSQPPDLIVLDLLIPRLSGIELLRQLQAEGLGAIPVVVITGRYSGDPDSEGQIRLEPNVREFYKKPVDYVRLCGRIRELLSLPGPSRAPGP